MENRKYKIDYVMVLGDQTEIPGVHTTDADDSYHARSEFWKEFKPPSSVSEVMWGIRIKSISPAHE
jgi:hypothetical protein